MANLDWRRARRRRKVRATSIGAASTVALIGVWYLCTDVLGLVSPLFLPSPVAVIERLVEFTQRDYQGATLIGHLFASLRIVAISWFVAGLIGLPIGVAMGWSRRVRTVVSPIFELIRPIPPIAWIPLAILWFGLGTEARVFVVTISAIVPWVLNSYEAVAGVDKLLAKASRSLGAPSRRTLVEVVLPAAVPTLVGGARIALGNAWMTVVAAELLGATAGLGFVALNARSTMDPDIMLVAMLLIGLLGVVFSEGLRLVEKRLSGWKESAA